MTVSEILKAGNYHLIDVREEMELQMDGQVEGAQNIPLGEIEERIQEIIDLNGPKIMFCRSGARSERATQFLKNQGMADIYNGGGFRDVIIALEEN